MRHHSPHSHVGEPGLWLHSRPPRQRLPSSLVIEGVSAPTSRWSSSYSRRDTSDNASDLSRVILTDDGRQGTGDPFTSGAAPAGGDHRTSSRSRGSRSSP